MRVDPNASVMSGGQPRAAKEALVIGRQVRVQYQMVDGQAVAQRIDELATAGQRLQGRRAR